MPPRQILDTVIPVLPNLVYCIVSASLIPGGKDPRPLRYRRMLMKKIEAIIQPHKLEDVKEALKAIGIDGMTVTEVRGHGRQRGHKEVYRGMEYQVDLLPKMKLEIVVPSERSTEVIRALADSARTGKIGDGKIFVYDVAEAIRIRNDDRGENAL